MPDSAPKKLDRRVVRTRRMLRDALIALIEERGYDPITVQDITDRADLARTTFYLHYKDKDELLFSSMQEIYDDLLSRIRPGVMDDDADWRHVAEHADFYRTMLGEHGSTGFVVKLREFLAEVLRRQVLVPLIRAQGDDPRLPLDFMAHYLAGAQVGMMAWWLENDMPHSPEEMAQMGQQMAVNGLLWALNAPDT